MFELFAYGFVVRAFLAGAIIAIIAPAIGMFLVVRRYSLMADTLSHVALVGVAVGLVSGVQPILAATVTAGAAAVAIDRLRTSRRLSGESALALFLSGSLALAVVVLGLYRRFTVDLFSFLFGSITTVSAADVWTIFALGVVVLMAIFIFSKELFLISFNEDLARSSGLPVAWLNAMLMVLSGITIALSMRVVGTLLVGALMVIPVSTALQFGRGFLQTMALSVLVSLSSVFFGLFISYYADIPSGATIVLCSLVLFGVATLFHKT